MGGVLSRGGQSERGRQKVSEREITKLRNDTCIFFTCVPNRNLQHAMCPYTVMYELSNEQALPIEPTVIKAAVATKITLRPTMSAREPAGGR